MPQETPHNRQSAEKVPKPKRPQPKGGSRKGIPNKKTAALKDAIRQALDEAGGVAYLVACAEDPRRASAFLSLVGKILPLQVEGSIDHRVHKITRTVIKP